MSSISNNGICCLCVTFFPCIVLFQVNHIACCVVYSQCGNRTVSSDKYTDRRTASWIVLSVWTRNDDNTLISRLWLLLGMVQLELIVVTLYHIGLFARFRLSVWTRNDDNTLISRLLLLLGMLQLELLVITLFSLNGPFMEKLVYCTFSL